MNSANEGKWGDPWPTTYMGTTSDGTYHPVVKLKPCPFCHGKVELRQKMDGYDETCFIHCTKCHMWFEKFDYRAMDEKRIIKEWNRRAEE